MRPWRTVLFGLALLGPVLFGLAAPSQSALVQSALAQSTLAQPAQTRSPQPARPLEIVSPERPPYVFGAGGTASGPAVDLLQRIVRASDVPVDPGIRLLPFQRAVRDLEAGGCLYPALLRTPQREARFQWIGEVFEDRAVLFTHADRPAVADAADARRLERISVMRGSELQALLKSFDLHNVESNIAETDNARLLRAGRIDGWFTLRTVGRATWKLLDYPAHDLRAGESFALMSFWIAASRDVPAAAVARLRGAYDRLRKTGDYDRIVMPLREPPS
jgi:polar amino acid transport system substrate-binding protein